MSEVEQAVDPLAYLAGTKVCVRAYSAKIGGRDWFVAGKLGAIVLCFKRKISLHKIARKGRGAGCGVVEWFVSIFSVLRTYFRCKLGFLLSILELCSL